MKIKSHFTHLLLIAGLLFAIVTACNKTNDPGGDIPSAGELKDADSNVYKTVKIGSQVWMAENLKTTKYNDGSSILNVTESEDWLYLTTGAYCNYDNLESNAVTYGRLYNWYSLNTGILAPTGWHVPTDDDWTILENYLIANGYNYDGAKKDNKFAKSLASTTGWALSSETGTPGIYPEKNNSTGFTAPSGGYRTYYGKFTYIGEGGCWWSSTESSTNYAYNRGLNYDYNSLYSNYAWKECGFSVRLVKD